MPRDLSAQVVQLAVAEDYFAEVLGNPNEEVCMVVYLGPGSEVNRDVPLVVAMEASELPDVFDHYFV